jgi:glycerol kinase
VYRPAECEATARGTAFLLAGRPQHWPEPGPGTMFSPQANEALRQRYQRWRLAMNNAIAKARANRRG